MELVIITLAGLATALATGLGVPPVHWSQRHSQSLQRWGHAAAAIIMVVTSAGLLWSAAHTNWLLMLAGVALGVAVSAGSGWLSTAVENDERSQHKKMSNKTAGAIQKSSEESSLPPPARTPRAWHILAIMTLHSASEGIAVGVAFAGGENFGAAVTVSMAAHNIPEGLAIALVLIPLGYSLRLTTLLAIGTSLPQALFAAPAFAVSTLAAPLVPLGLAMAGSAMIHLCVTDLIPAAVRKDAGATQGHQAARA